jgi:pyruvate dehydrogenase E1 component
MQEPNGGAIYLRLTTRVISQPSRQMSDELRENLLKGAYWLENPGLDSKLAIIVSGAVTPEAKNAYEILKEEIPKLGLLLVSSTDKLYHDWLSSKSHSNDTNPNVRSHIESLLNPLADDACLITVSDSHPASLSWIGSVMGHKPYCLGVTDFGESGDIIDLYSKHNIDTDSIIEAAATACLQLTRLSKN